MNNKQKTRLLTNFCATEYCIDKRLQKPLRANGFLYATNQHVLVKIPDDFLILAYDCPADLLASLESFFSNQHTSPRSFTVPKLPKAAPCPICLGMQRIDYTPCATCGGTGQQKNGEECPTCEGQGRTDSNPNKKGGHTCYHCGGFGEDPEPYSFVDGIPFANRYLRAIRNLPNIRLCPTSARSPMVCSFDGGTLLMMPIGELG